MNVSTMRIGAAMMSVFLLLTQADAVQVTSGQASVAARNWLRRGYGFERQMGSEIESVRTLAGTNGASLHVAEVRGGGFVVLGSDTEDSPVVAVSASGRCEPDERNPLWILLRQDMAARSRAKAEKRRMVRASAGQKAAAGTSPQERWAKLLEQDDADGQPPNRRVLLSAANGKSSVSDVRVGALVESVWSQEDYRNYGFSSDDDICYNYYTPNHWPCGCVATAGAQVMRYHAHPTVAVEAGTYACEKGGSPVNLTMKGGLYDWDSMTLVPANGCSAVSREAIGKLTYDVGVSVGMSYGSGGSSAADYLLAKRFVDRYQYANAVSVVFKVGFYSGGGYPYSLDRFKAAVIPSLDAGLPVVLGISNTSYGHAVVGDGYGYSDGDFFVHVNLGWANMNGGNAWYMPPDIDTYTSIDSIVYNVYPTGTSGASIVSGRVLSPEGLPVKGVSVRAVAGGVAAANATSGGKGGYALKVEPGDWWIVAEKDGHAASNRITVASCVSPHVDDAGSYYSDIRPQIGNVCDNNLTLDATETPEPPKPITVYEDIDQAKAAAIRESKLVFLLSGATWCEYTAQLKQYITDAGSVFTDNYVYLWHDQDQDAFGIAATSSIPEFWIFQPSDLDLSQKSSWDSIALYVCPGCPSQFDSFLRILESKAELKPGKEVLLSLSGVGWHEVSFPVLPEGGDPADVFAPVADRIGYVTYGSKNWSSKSGSTLTTLEIGKGYWVQTTAENVSWTVSGQTNPDVEIALKPGWNLIGYPLLEAGEVETVLATALATGKIDYIYSGSRVYPGTLTTMAPGKGYWVYANAAVTIRFDAKAVPEGRSY